MDQAYDTVWRPEHVPPILIHGTKFENLESIEANGIRPSSSRPIHMISRRYQVMVANGEVSGKLAKVDCLIHIDSELVRASWRMAGWGGNDPQWFTSGSGVFLCKSVIAWSYVSFVECRQPHLTLYNRKAGERSRRSEPDYCTMCQQPSASGWQFCMHTTPTGICFTPLTKAGAHDMLTSAKRTAMFDVARELLQAGQVSLRYGQAGGQGPKPVWGNQKVTKYVSRARKLGFYSHYVRYLYDDKFRQDCVENGVPQELYLEKKWRGKKWLVPAEEFEVPEEVAQNWGDNSRVSR